MRQILTRSHPGEIEVALLEDDVLTDFLLHRPGSPDGLGDLHRGVVRTLVPAMAGAFVAIEGGDGFLPDSAGAAGLTVGAVVTVRISRAAQGGKGPRLALVAESAAEPGPAPRLLARGPHPIDRLAARHPEAAIRVDTSALAAALTHFRARLTIDPAGFDAVLADAVDALGEPSLALPQGPVIHVFPTPALVAIDVDLAAATAGGTPRRAAQLAANRALLPALAAQIRLRNLGGAILVDLAGMGKKARAGLAAEFSAALAADPVPTRLLGFTALGLAEIVRTRTSPPLHELRAGPLAAGFAALRALAAAARPGAGQALRAAPGVVAALQADAVGLAELAQRTGHPLMLRSEPGLSALAWRIESAP
jgi:hypothetical protein